MMNLSQRRCNNTRSYLKRKYEDSMFFGIDEEKYDPQNDPAWSEVAKKPSTSSKRVRNNRKKPVQNPQVAVRPPAPGAAPSPAPAPATVPAPSPAVPENTTLQALETINDIPESPVRRGRRKVQAQRKFAQGAFVPPSNNVPERRRDVTPKEEVPVHHRMGQNTIVKMPARSLLDVVAFKSMHKHMQPVVLLKRLSDSPNENVVRPAVKEKPPENDNYVVNEVPSLFKVRRYSRLKTQSNRIMKAKALHTMKLRSRRQQPEKKRPKAPKRTLPKEPPVVRPRRRRVVQPSVSEFSVDDYKPLTYFTNKVPEPATAVRPAPVPPTPRSPAPVSPTPGPSRPILDDMSETQSEFGPTSRDPALSEELFSSISLAMDRRVISLSDLLKFNSGAQSDLNKKLIADGLPPIDRAQASSLLEKLKRPYYSGVQIARWVDACRQSATIVPNEIATEMFKAPLPPPPALLRKRLEHPTLDIIARGDDDTISVHSFIENPDCPSKNYITVKDVLVAPKQEIESRCKKCKPCSRVDKVHNIANLVLMPLADNVNLIEDIYEFKTNDDMAISNTRMSHYRGARQDKQAQRTTSTALAEPGTSRGTSGVIDGEPLYLDIFPEPGTHIIQIMSHANSTNTLCARFMPKSQVTSANELSLIEHENLLDQLALTLQACHPNAKQLLGRTDTRLQITAPCSSDVATEPMADETIDANGEVDNDGTDTAQENSVAGETKDIVEDITIEEETIMDRHGTRVDRSNNDAGEGTSKRTNITRECIVLSTRLPIEGPSSHFLISNVTSIETIEVNETPRRSNETPRRLNETPTISTETPSRSTETPKRLNKTPSLTTETPSRSTEIPRQSNETPRRLNETSTISTEIPSRSIKIPSRSTEIPRRSNETPRRLNETPTLSTEIPSRLTENPKPLNETPSLSIETPSRSTEIPSRSTETPRRLNKTPRLSSETPSRSTETPKRSKETPKRSNETPRLSIETPRRSIETPRRSTETPMRSTETPRRSIETPTRSTDTPRRSNERETRRTEAAKSTKKQTFPKSLETAKLVDAPVFYPTEAEFQDPISYFEKIMPSAAKFGLCKIVAPAGFKPKCKSSDDIRFNVMNQYVARLYSRWGPAQREMCAIKAYLATQSVVFTRPPLLDCMEIDLPKLYHMVQHNGGLKRVIEKKRWSRVADNMRNSRCLSPGKKLDYIYVKYLLPYGTLSHQERYEMIRKVERCWFKKNQKMLDRAVNPLHRQKKLLGESDSSADEDDDEEEDENVVFALMEAEDCVVVGRHMNLAMFKRTAANMMTVQFPRRHRRPTVSDVEAEYWKLVLLGTSHVCVNSASIDTGNEGYGFTKNKNDPYGKHPWNLKMLSQNPHNVLRSLGPVLGVTVPTLHLGMLYSTSCWHRDPHGLPWIEYMHNGPSKIWYGIPDEQSDNFRKAVEKLCPTSCQNKSIWLPSDITMIPPTLLCEHSVSLSRVTQKPGEFIIVFPKAYSSSIATGYTQSESVYFASNSWLNSVHHTFQEARQSCEPTMFSLEQLLVSVARDPKVSLAVLQQVHAHLSPIIMEELTNRRTLRSQGFKFIETRNTRKQKPRRRAGAWNVREQDECEICRTTLYFSKVTNLTGKKTCVCLQHALQLIELPKYADEDLSTYEVVLLFPDNEIQTILKNVKKKLSI